MLTDHNFEEKKAGVLAQMLAGKNMQNMCLHALTLVILARLVINFMFYFLKNKCLHLLLKLQFENICLCT